MDTTKNRMPEEQAVSLVRNALLVAGTEMGVGGDHWPVVKSTIHTIAKDWEDLKTERNVFDEVRAQFQSMLKELEALCNESPTALQPQIRTAVIELLEIYHASFAPTHEIHLDSDSMPLHIKRAEALIKTLENSHE